MSKRTKGESKEWDNQIKTMFKEVEGSDLVKNRYKAIRYLLRGIYGGPIGVTLESGDVKEQYIKDVVYLDRKLRLWTEHKEQPLKQQLSEEFQVEELGFQIGV